LNKRTSGRPLFELRGLNPWGSHPFGFDLWNTDDYKAHIGQMAKMRMNFIGMHCYPEGHPYAEPTVWEGIAGDFDARGRVKVTGAGHLERFDYWLGTMRYLRAGAKLDCAVGNFLAMMKKVNAEKDPAWRRVCRTRSS